MVAMVANGPFQLSEEEPQWHKVSIVTHALGKLLSTPVVCTMDILPDEGTLQVDDGQSGKVDL